MKVNNWQEADKILNKIAAAHNCSWYLGSGYPMEKPHIIATTKDSWSGEGQGYNVFIYPNGSNKKFIYINIDVINI